MIPTGAYFGSNERICKGVGWSNVALSNTDNTVIPIVALMGDYTVPIDREPLIGQNEPFLVHFEAMEV